MAAGHLRLEVLFEDNHCLVVNKPPRMLTVGDVTGDTSLLDMARDYVRARYGKPGRVFLGVVHRLDRPVSGVVLFARTSKAAARLSSQFRQHAVTKTYHCLVEGTVAHLSGTLIDWATKDSARNVLRILQGLSEEGQRCVLQYRRLQQIGSHTHCLKSHSEPDAVIRSAPSWLTPGCRFAATKNTGRS